METFTWDLQLGMGGGAFASGKFAAGKFGGSTWLSVLSDVRTVESPEWSYGINGSDPSDRIADTGQLTFGLNNGAWNSSQTLGWYSPLNAVKRGRFDFNIPTRLLITWGGMTFYKFYGRLANIQPDTGEHGARISHCTALDLFDDWARTPCPPLDTQFDKRGDELLQLIIGALPTELQPAVRSIQTGIDTHPIAFDTFQEESMSIREALLQVCQSDFARLYMIGTTAAPGGLLVYRNRHYASLNTDVVPWAVMDSSRIANGGLEMLGSRDDLVSKVQVFVRPTRTDPAATTVLFSLQTTATLVRPGETNNSLFGPYRDPDNPGDRIGGIERQPLEAGLDYVMNTAEDGTGADVTDSFTVVASSTAAGVHFTITNHGTVPAFVITLQIRGRGVYRSTVVAEKTLDTGYGFRVLQIDMPFQSRANVGDDVATYTANVLSTPLARIQPLTFLANLTNDNMAAALMLEPGDRISVTEPVAGLDGDEFLINRCSYRLEPAAETTLLWCTWQVEPADTNRYWLIGIPGSSEIGTTDRLAF